MLNSAIYNTLSTFFFLEFLQFLSLTLQNTFAMKIINSHWKWSNFWWAQFWMDHAPLWIWAASQIWDAAQTLKLYSVFWDLSRRSIWTGLGGSATRFKFFKLGLGIHTTTVLTYELGTFVLDTYNPDLLASISTMGTFSLISSLRISFQGIITLRISNKD